MKILRFLCDTQAGATAITSAAVVVITVGATALVTDHKWLVDQRDVLKTAADAAGVAATLEMTRILNAQPAISDDALKAALKPVARRYVELNLGHLSGDRYTQAMGTLDVDIVPQRLQSAVDVSAQADLGGTLLSRHMPMFESVAPSRPVRAVTQVESVTNPIEVVLAIDISTSMDSLLNGTAACINCANLPPELQAIVDPDGNRGPENRRIEIVRRAAAQLVGILGPSAVDRVAIGVVPWHTQVRLDSDVISDWARLGWAMYPTRRVYGEPYVCRGNNCVPPALVEQALASVAPEDWMGCLDGHRMGSVGTRASVPATSEFFTTPSSNAFAQAFFSASQGAAYECPTPPLPADLAWNVCYHGRKYNNYNTNDADPDGPQRECWDGTAEILPLSTNADTIVETIEELAPVGHRTYSALGVLWGQRLLEHSWKNVWGDAGDVHPVDPAARESEGLRKAIVLLTDGEDTHCGFGNETCADSRVGISRTDACTAAKDAGTEIFVIAAMHPDRVSDALGDSLRECSSESEESDVTYAFLDNSTPEELTATFAEIASQLRIVRRVN